MWRDRTLINIASGDGLVLDGIKPLPEPMLTYKQCGLVAITQGQFKIKCSCYDYENEIEIMLFKLQLHFRDQ